MIKPSDRAPGLAVAGLFVATLVATAACGPSAETLSLPPAVGNPGATAREPIKAAMRPDVTKSFSLDYAAVPYLVATPLSAEDSSAGVAMNRSASGADQARVGGDLLAEIELGSLRVFTSEPLIEAHTATKDPAKNPAGDTVADCTTRPGTSPIKWEGFALGTWSDRFIDYVRYEGTYDYERCKAKPTRAAHVRAVALIPGVAYAFRTCVPVCGSVPDAPSSEEQLVIIGPPSKWVGSTSPYMPLQTQPHVGLFTRLIVPLKRGGSASAFSHVQDVDLTAFIGRRRNRGSLPDLPKAPLLQISFDFSWPETDPAPIGVGFVGPVTADARSGSTYTFQDESVAELIVQ